MYSVYYVIYYTLINTINVYYVCRSFYIIDIHVGINEYVHVFYFVFLVTLPH